MWSQLHNKLQMPKIVFLTPPKVAYINWRLYNRTKGEGGEDHSPTTHPKVDFWQLPALSLLQGADNEYGYGLISALFLLQGAGD